MADEKNDEVVDMDEEIKKKLEEPEDGDTTSEEPNSKKLEDPEDVNREHTPDNR